MRMPLTIHFIFKSLDLRLFYSGGADMHVGRVLLYIEI